MAEDKTWHQRVLEKIASFFPQPVAGAARRSTEQRERVQGAAPSKEEIAAGVAEPPKSEGKSHFEGTPRQKFYK